MENFGEYLKAQREKKGIRLEEIASITKIHLRSLELLEAGRLEQLPPEPFLRGFISAYAKYVGLDPKEVLTRYLESTAPESTRESEQTAMPEAEPPPAGESPTEVIQQERVFPSRKVFGALAVVLVALLTLALIYVGKSSSRPLIAEVEPPTIKTAMGRSPAALPSPSPGPNAASVPMHAPKERLPEVKVPAGEKSRTQGESATTPKAGHVLTVEMKYRSWAKIVIDDKPPVQTILDEGKKVIYDANQKIKLVLGNAAGAQVTHNGEADEGTKYQGTVRYWVFPPHSRFAQDPPRPRKPPALEAEHTTAEEGSLEEEERDESVLSQ